MDTTKTANFFFVGPSKTGSTWIYQALQESSEVCLPASKDIYFFDKFYGRGVKWYESQFPRGAIEKLSGEFSHDYLLSQIGLERIRAYNPEARIMVCLREPLERTFSGIKFLRRNGYGFEGIRELVQKHTELIEGSLYGKNLERVYSIFPAEQVLLLSFDELSNSPTQFLGRICDFLGISRFEPSIIGSKVNEAKSARSRWISFAAKKSAMGLRNLGFGGIVGRLKMHKGVHQLLFSNASEKLELAEADRDFLVEFFRADLDVLHSLGYADDAISWTY